MRWRTYLPHRAERAGFLILQVVGGKRWSLAFYIKPKPDVLTLIENAENGAIFDA